MSYRFLGFLRPAPQSSYKRGAAIPVKFRLANAAGVKLSDAVAQALITPTCLVRITLDGTVQAGCATYNASANTFAYSLRTARTITVGTHRVGIQVSAPDGSGVVNIHDTEILIK